MNLNFNIPEYGVTQFNRALKDLIEDHFSYVRIKGEISELRLATKGQIYITLKDQTSILSAVVWEQKKRLLTFEPETGMEVVLNFDQVVIFPVKITSIPISGSNVIDLFFCSQTTALKIDVSSLRVI